MSSQSSSISGRLGLLAVLAIAVFSLSACQTSTTGNLYGYDFTSARISYQVTGSSVGTSEVLIEGEKKVIHNNIVQTKVDGTKATVNTFLIQDGEKLYTLDPTTKTGSLLKQPFYSDLQKLAPADRKNSILAEELRISTTPDQQVQIPKPEKTETIAGQVCDYYKGTMSDTCLWEGIPLHTVASLPDYGIQTETTASKIELNQPIADSEFAVPSDYKITDLN